MIMEPTSDQGSPRLLPKWKSLKIGKTAQIAQNIFYWDQVWPSFCIGIVDDDGERNVLSILQGLSGWHPVILRSVPPLTECVQGDRTWPGPYMGQVMSNEVSAHYRRQWRNYWDTTETIHISHEALATRNHPVKYQSPTAKSVSTRANLRKSDRACPGLPYLHRSVRRLNSSCQVSPWLGLTGWKPAVAISFFPLPFIHPPSSNHRLVYPPAVHCGRHRPASATGSENAFWKRTTSYHQLGRQMSIPQNHCNCLAKTLLVCNRHSLQHCYWCWYWDRTRYFHQYRL